MEDSLLSQIILTNDQLFSAMSSQADTQMRRAASTIQRAARKVAAGKSKRSSTMSGRRSAKQIRRIALRDVEKKRFNTALGSVILNGFQVILLNGIAQGDDSNQRDGRTLTMKGLDCHVAITPALATAINTFGYWAVVLDKMPDQALPPASEIYGGGVTDPILQARNATFLERFKVLKREDFVVGPYGSGNSYNLKFYLNLDTILDSKDQRVRFGSSAGTIAAMTANPLYFVYVPSNQATMAPGSNYCYIAMECQLVFTDN